ncbi:MAG TPA: hypothetical protein VHJ34_13800 [Actinomycetota bacterium]|nr:hypothetical protein [Actinomycetota bacterium]
MDQHPPRPDHHGDEAVGGQDASRRTPKDPGGSGDLAGGERRSSATRPIGVVTIVLIGAALVLALGGALWYLFR